MENQQEKDNWFSRLTQSIAVKLATVGFISLILLIPSSWIADLIIERQQRQKEVVDEIARSWAGNQTLTGPVLVLPYRTFQEQKAPDGKVELVEAIQRIFLMPERLDMKTRVEPEVLHRGIFDVVVYQARVDVAGTFAELDTKKLGIDPQSILWNQTQLLVNVSDVKGLKQIPQIRVAGTQMSLEPDYSDLQVFNNGLACAIDWSSRQQTKSDFSFTLQLRGSEALSFTPVGKTTRFEVTGNWSNPSFTGGYLPEKRNVADSAFTATWSIPYFNRPFPQQWVGNDGKRLQTSDADHSGGVRFLLPVDQYQKTMRSAKYAMLIILLTFVSLLFTEWITKRRVNVLQYVLIGSAMVIYYTLLLSFSEQVGFTWAYVIASLCTIILIGTFLYSILSNKKASTMLAGILSAFYLFIYVIIQLQEMALLVGSVGLFVVVALLMYASSRINWDKRE